MKRLVLWVLFAGLLLVTVLAAGGAWLLGTVPGNNWLISQLEGRTPVRVDGSIERPFWQGLQVKDLQITWPGGQVVVTRFDLHWNPWALLHRHLAIDTLNITDTSVTWEAGDKPQPAVSMEPQLNWPAVPAVLKGWTAELGRLQLNQLRLQPPASEPVILQGIAAGLDWADGSLGGTDLRVSSPYGSLNGKVKLSLSDGVLDAHLDWQGDMLPRWFDHISLKAELKNSEVPLGGPIEIRVERAGDALYALEGNFRLSPGHLTGDRLVLVRPGQPDRVEGEASLEWSGEEFRVIADLNLDQVDIGPETGWPMRLTGSVRGELDPQGYHALVDAENRRPGWELQQLTAKVEGDWRGLRVEDIRGHWLDGSVTGEVEMSWEEGYRLWAEVEGEGVNPGILVPGMTGALNLHVLGGLQVPREGSWSAHWDADLGESRLRDRPLQGRFYGDWRDGDLRIRELDLAGEGLRVQARGELSERLDVSLEVKDLGRILEGGAGQVIAEGWMAYAEGDFRGRFSGDLNQVQAGPLQAESGRFRLYYPGRQVPGKMELQFARARFQEVELDRLQLEVAGLVEDHQLKLQSSWPFGSLYAAANGGWREASWEGSLLELQGTERNLGRWTMTGPAPLTVSAGQLSLGRVMLRSERGGTLNLEGELATGDPPTTKVDVAWQKLSLAFLNPWLAGPELKGISSGEAHVDLSPGGGLRLNLHLGMQGTLSREKFKLELADSELQVHWNELGLEVGGDFNLAQGGTVRFDMESSEPGQLAWPELGTMNLSWDDAPLVYFNPYLPERLHTEGHWFGKFQGSWKGQGRFEIEGRSWLDGGQLTWFGEDGVARVSLRRAETRLAWRGQELSGETELALAEEGTVRGSFGLPLAASLPVRFDPNAPLRAESSFKLAELGLVTLFFPGVIEEGQGQLAGEVGVKGSWAKPKLQGALLLRNAGGSVPPLGLVLKDLELEGRFSGSDVTLDRFQVRSGPGTLNGSGHLSLDGWNVDHWELELQGEQVQVVDLAEFRMVADPKVRLSGNIQRMSITGEVLLPEVLVTQVQSSGIVTPSPDVELVGEGQANGSKPLRIDLDLLVRLGDQVVVKAKGLDAKLEGEVQVSTTDQRDVVGRGEIRVAKGHYAAYGIKVPITRGRATFSGGPIETPTLNVLAQRTIETTRTGAASDTPPTPGDFQPPSADSDTIKAGLLVTGTPRIPKVQLVSEPSMPETDILSYLVLGRPLGTGSGQNSALLLAAGALLSKGESVALQEQLKRRLGIDVLEVQSGGGDVEQSMVTIGKYLTPDLYLSFGQSLFVPSSVARLRYRMGKRWELESQLGTVSGADLYYRLEFE